MGCNNINKKVHNEPNIYISTALVAASGTGAGCLIELVRQKHLNKLSKQNSDKFLKNINNKKIRNKYSYIYQNHNSTIPKIKANVKSNSNILIKKMGIVGGLIATFSYLVFKSIKSIFSKKQNNNKLD